MLLADAPPAGWLTPDGVTAIISVVAMLLSVGVAVAKTLGKRELVDKLAAADARFGAAAGALTSVVRGVEDFRRINPTTAKLLAERVRAVALEQGTEGVLAPVVQAVTAAGGTAADAIPAAPPPVPTPPGGVRRVS
jgi:hypothetical protein